MTVARLGYEIDSSGAVVAAGNLDKMSAAAKVAETQQVSLKGAMGELNRLTGKASAEFIRLKASEDSAFAAAVKLKQAQDLLSAELKSGNINADQYAASLGNLEARYRSQIAVAGAAGAAANKFGGAMKVSSMHTANLGAQINDIGVMLAAGQNPLQLAVQQGTQINQVFAQMGGGRQALRGLAAGFMSMVNPMSLATIGIIAGGAALVQWGVDALGASDEAERFESRLDSLSGMMEGLNSSSDMLEWSMDELTEKFGHQAEVVRGLIVNLAQYRVSIAQNELREFGDLARIATDQFSGLSRSAALVDQEMEYLNQQNTAFAKSRIDDLTKQIAEEAAKMGEQFGITADEAIVLSDAFAQLGSAGTTEQINKELVDLNELMKELGISTEMIPDELEQAIAKMSELGILSAELAETMRQVSANSNFAPGLNPNMPVSSLLPPRQRDSGGRSGGGSRVDQFARDLERLRESLRTEQEVVTEWYSEQQAILDNRRALEILGIEGHNEAKLRLEQEYQERLAGIREDGNRWGVQAAIEGGAEILGAMGAFSDKALKAHAITAAGMAWISTLQGAAKELEKGTFGFATAAAVITKGTAFVAAIRAASSGSSSGTSASAGVTASSAASAAPQQTRAIVAVQSGRSRFTIEEVNDIARQLQEQSRDGVIIEGFVQA